VNDPDGAKGRAAADALTVVSEGLLP
jgi:hypothetical protein